MRIVPKSMFVLTAAVTIGIGLLGEHAVAAAQAIGSPRADQSLVPQGHIYTGVSEEPADVNPFTAQGQAARRLVLGYTHEGLLDACPRSGGLRPAAAERFEMSADGMACTFTLRSGLAFADGSAVSLDDVLFGWELARAGHLRLGFVGDAFDRVAGAERLDDRRLRVQFKDRHYANLRIVGMRWLVAKKAFFVDRIAVRCRPEPVPDVGSTAFATWLAQIDHECGPGTGPYRLENADDGLKLWRPHQELLLVRNDRCWQRTARPGTWNFTGILLLFRDANAATNALLRGELDWFSSAAVSELLKARPDLAKDYQQLVYDYDALGLYRVIWNCREGPTTDARVRRALGMLFDVDGWRQGCEGIGPRAVAHAKPTSPAYPQLDPLPFDSRAARRLLREAGYDPEAGKPLKIVLFALQGTDALRRITDLFAAAAKQAGIEVDLRRRDYAAYQQEKATVAWHGLLVQQQFRPWGDPYDFVHSRGVDNEGGWQNQEVDRLAEAARVEADAERRDSLWREMHTIVHREQPVATLAHPMVSVLVHRRIEAAELGGSGLVLDRAFVAPERQQR